MFDASVPLSLSSRVVLDKVCEISFHYGSLLYLALNKVDLVNPKERLLDYSSTLSEFIWKKKIALLQAVTL